MTVYDLNRDQLTELKQRYYAEATGRDLSYEELANIDFYVTDYDVQREYAGVDFVMDDFFSTAGQDEPERPLLSAQLSEAIEYLRNIKGQGWWAFESPSPSSTEAKIKNGVLQAIVNLDIARRAALDSHI